MLDHQMTFPALQSRPILTFRFADEPCYTPVLSMISTQNESERDPRLCKQ
jgi:hypothetical protein